MSVRRNFGMAAGVALVVLGIIFLLIEISPAFLDAVNFGQNWPFVLVLLGILFLVFAFAQSTASLAIPGSIITGLGFLLLYQNSTGNWESWAYAWTLIPGFLGVGILLGGMIEGEDSAATPNGLLLIFISIVLLLIFGSVVGPFAFLGEYWPLLLVLLGVGVFLRNLIRQRQVEDKSDLDDGVKE